MNFCTETEHITYQMHFLNQNIIIIFDTKTSESKDANKLIVSWNKSNCFWLEINKIEIV